MTKAVGIKITPVTPRIGAVIEGVEFTQPLSDDVFDVVHEAWMNHLVLFALGPALTPAQHLALGERFGPLHILSLIHI